MNINYNNFTCIYNCLTFKVVRPASAMKYSNFMVTGMRLKR